MVRLARQRFPKMKVERSAACPEEVLRQRFTRLDNYILGEDVDLGALARHPNLAPDLQTRMTDPEFSFRSRADPTSYLAELAGNPSLCQEAADGLLATLDRGRLSAEEQSPVHTALLGNPTVRSQQVVLPPSVWQQLDPHEAHGIAADPSATVTLLVSQHAALLAESARALENGISFPAATPKTWDDLPNVKDEVYDLPPGADRIEGRAVDGLYGRLARDGRDLDRLHKRMGNCLDHYQQAAREQRVVVAAFEDPARENVYAVAWRCEGGKYRLKEINAKYNLAENVPRSFQDAVASVTHDLNSPPGIRSVAPPTSRRRTRIRQAPEGPGREAAPEAPAIDDPGHDVPPVRPPGRPIPPAGGFRF
jgi:hypothetical protein